MAQVELVAVAAAGIGYGLYHKTVNRFVKGAVKRAKRHSRVMARKAKAAYRAAKKA
jgi:hypothetical protein